MHRGSSDVEGHDDLGGNNGGGGECAVTTPRVINSIATRLSGVKLPALANAENERPRDSPLFARPSRTERGISRCEHTIVEEA